jgi:hypothetical protein
VEGKAAKGFSEGALFSLADAHFGSGKVVENDAPGNPADVLKDCNQGVKEAWVFSLHAWFQSRLGFAWDMFQFEVSLLCLLFELPFA